jgi:hypothetical protein
MPLYFIPLDAWEVNKTFRLNNGVLERYLPTGKWRKVNISPDRSGYKRIRINNRQYLLHRILWVLRNNKDIPNGMEIDHINGIKSNNSLDNLRIVSREENQQNRKCHRRGKLLGTTYLKRKKSWQAQINIEGKTKYLGCFKTEQEAHQAYITELTPISKILPKVMKAIEDKLFEPNKPFTLANKDYRINN